MRSLKLNDIATSLGIRVYCNHCGSWFDPRSEKLKIRKINCSHPPHKQRYKATIIEPINGRKRKRKSLVFNTRDLKEVVLLGLKFKHHVKTYSCNKPDLHKPKKSFLLIECLAAFLDFKHDVNVPDHLKKSLSKSSLTEFKSHILKWKQASDSIEEVFLKLRVDNISTKNISALISYLSVYSNSTQKKAFGFYNHFYRYLNENGYSLISPFKGIQVSDSPTSEPRAITQVEFNKIMDGITSGSKEDKVRGRSIYFEWLPEAFKFSALTGRRRIEFMQAKFSDVYLHDGNLLGGYIRMIDSKFTRQNKHKIGFKAKYSKAPIFKEVRDFLIENGYEEFKNSDRYIIAGDESKQRNTLANNLTNAFAFYRNKLNLDTEIQLKGNRKFYITRMRNEFGDNANFFTGHSSNGRIDKKHYYDDRELFEKVLDFKLWR